MKRLMLSLMLLSVLSCSSDKADNNIKKINIPLSDAANNIGLSQVADSVSYVFLESNDSSIIGIVDKLIVTDKYFIIADKEKTKSVLIFDNKGKFNDIDNSFKFMPNSGRCSNLYYIIEPTYIEHFRSKIDIISNNNDFNIYSNPIIAFVKLKP